MEIRFKINDEQWHNYLPSGLNNSVWQIFSKHNRISKLTLEMDNDVVINFERQQEKCFQCGESAEETIIDEDIHGRLGDRPICSSCKEIGEE